MSDCPFANNYENKEGWFKFTAIKDHHGYNKLVCIDWDAFCTRCLEESRQ